MAEGQLRHHGSGSCAAHSTRRRNFAFPSWATFAADAIVLALKPEFAGDRVFAFGVGLASMVFISYNEKTEFYLTDTLDPQKLYNSARNIEVAAWKLANARGARGEPLLLSNEAGADVVNLSFERVRQDDRLSGRHGGDRCSTDQSNDSTHRANRGDNGVLANLSCVVRSR